MKRVEVSMTPDGKSTTGRAPTGQFSGSRHAFAQAEEAAGKALKKFALFSDKTNPADFLAKLFRTRNFGYDSNENPPIRRPL